MLDQADWQTPTINVRKRYPVTGQNHAAAANQLNRRVASIVHEIQDSSAELRDVGGATR